MKAGERFGLLEVLALSGSDNGRVYECRCDCGNTIHRKGTQLRRKEKIGHLQSCGCHGPSETHGETGTRLYRAWTNMRNRCHRPEVGSYQNYGGRGISVCSEWRDSFEVFALWARDNGYSEHLTLERKDVNGNYCPENCCWATLNEQARNKRNNRLITWNGMSLTCAGWSEITGISPVVLRMRIKHGWDDERIMTQPVRRSRYADPAP